LEKFIATCIDEPSQSLMKDISVIVAAKITSPSTPDLSSTKIPENQFRKSKKKSNSINVILRKRKIFWILMRAQCILSPALPFLHQFLFIFQPFGPSLSYCFIHIVFGKVNEEV
jgi:hypothetical protein